jgi:hypothetical protein
MAIHRRWELPAVLSLGKTQARDPTKRWQRVHVQENEQARRIIEFGREQFAKLRHLLASDCYNVSAMTDAEVTDRAAVMLVRGEWVLLEQVAVETSKQSLGSSAAARSIAAVSPDTPMLRQLPSRKPEAIALPVDEPGETFDQEAQAATLRLAAANGTPFCEICEKRRRDRSAPRTHRGAA